MTTKPAEDVGGLLICWSRESELFLKKCPNCALILERFSALICLVS